MHVWLVMFGVWTPNQDISRETADIWLAFCPGINGQQDPGSIPSTNKSTQRNLLFHDQFSKLSSIFINPFDKHLKIIELVDSN